MDLIAHTSDDTLSAVPLRLNRLFENLFAAPAEPQGGWTPRMDVVETADAIEVLIDLPGIDPKLVELSIHKDRFEIRGERTKSEAPAGARWYHFERAAGPFHRVLRLPVPVDADKARAESHHGLLHVTLPKTADVMPKRISIKGK